MLNSQKSVSDRTGLGYDLSSSNIASTSTTVFVPLANNVKLENPLNLRRKMLKTLRLKRLTLKSLNRRSSISVIIVELLVILDQITISG